MSEISGCSIDHHRLEYGHGAEETKLGRTV